MEHAKAGSGEVPAWLGQGGAAAGPVRYIKLGPGGTWAQEALERGFVPFGYPKVAHEACLKGDWTKVREQLLAMGRTSSGAGQGLRELKDFYGLPADALWVTLANGHLWWTFADTAVVMAETGASGGPTRYRRTIGGWRRCDLKGQPLAVAGLSSALTRVEGFRMTLCSIEREDYLLRRIRGEATPAYAKATRLQTEMVTVLRQMIEDLHWQDFEVLVDLIFTRSGWQRTSILGQTQRDVDLLLEQPLTGEQAWVQVKSKANQRVLDDYLGRFKARGGNERFFFVCHSPHGTLSTPPADRLHVWSGDVLARNALAAGMYDWLAAHSR